MDLVEDRLLGTAGAAPARPEVEDQDLAPIVTQGEFVVVEGGAGRIGDRIAFIGLENGGAAVTGDEAVVLAPRFDIGTSGTSGQDDGSGQRGRRQTWHGPPGSCTGSGTGHRGDLANRG